MPTLESQREDFPAEYNEPITIVQTLPPEWDEGVGHHETDRWRQAEITDLSEKLASLMQVHSALKRGHLAEKRRRVIGISTPNVSGGTLVSG